MRKVVARENSNPAGFAKILHGKSAASRGHGRRVGAPVRKGAWQQQTVRLLCIVSPPSEVTPIQQLLNSPFMHSMASFKTFILALAFVLSCGSCWGETADELVKQGNVHDLKFNPTEALKFYLPAEQLEPKNADLMERIARQYRHQMADTPIVKDKIRLSGMALSYAERAVVLAPKDSNAHLSIAICHAKSVDLYSSKEKMHAMRQVKISVDRAIALDSGNHLAWYMLGRWHQRVSDLGGIKRFVAEMAYGELPKASFEDSVKCFSKAIQLNPDRSVYHVDVGITYALMGDKENARKSIEKGLALPTTGKDDPETKKRGAETLKTLK
jgi:tetratricopeptide (TPR) repeat protein